MKKLLLMCLCAMVAVPALAGNNRCFQLFADYSATPSPHLQAVVNMLARGDLLSEKEFLPSEVEMLQAIEDYFYENHYDYEGTAQLVKYLRKKLKPEQMPDIEWQKLLLKMRP